MLNAEKTSADLCGSLFAIVDKRLPKKQAEKLRSFGFSLIFLESDERLPSAMQSHTDMLIFKHGRTLIAPRTYLAAHKQTESKILHFSSLYDIRLSDTSLADKYPADARFNAKVIGKNLFCKSESVCEDILSYANEAGLKTVRVKQGYPACTVLSVGEALAFTSDSGMAKALIDERIDTVLIPESEKILLPPYKNGFIGGCTAVFENKIFFFGNAKALPYFDILKERVSHLGYEIISLDEECDSLFDLGGAVFLQKRF